MTLAEAFAEMSDAFRRALDAAKSERAMRDSWRRGRCDDCGGVAAIGSPCEGYEYCEPCYLGRLHRD